MKKKNNKKMKKIMKNKKRKLTSISWLIKMLYTFKDRLINRSRDNCKI